MRHFGVDGIDGRDDRNQPTGEFSDRETEIALGYGRAMSESWSVGVAARVRRQELAGRSGSGLGADAGLMLRPGRALGAAGWMRDVRVGIAAQNLVEPSIRLDRESVADPFTLRTGVALARPWSTGGMLVSVDVEKPRDVGARVHAGVEVRPRSAVALRSGLDGGAFTAGLAIRFAAAAFDYAFVDRPTGPAHRGGLTWRFGLAVNEARLAAEREEDRRLQERLAQLEHDRRRERVEALLAGAEAARAAGRPDEALDALATLFAIDSANAEGHALRVASLRDRARALEAEGDWANAAVTWARALSESPGDSAAASGLARSRGESDLRQRRSAELRRAFAAALDAFANDDLPSARAGLAAILRQDSTDAEAQAMARRVHAAIARRASSWLRQADALLQAGSLAEASRTIETVRQLDPRAPGIVAAAGALARAEQAQANDRARATAAAGRARATTAPPPRSAPPALTSEQRRQVADLYRRGLAALEAGQSDEALRYWELVRSLQPGHERVDELLKREYLTRGMELFSSGRLDAAERMWERALQVDPRDARTLGYLARVHEQMARAREISEDAP
jgi:tetratricopeptide (TPR) repeat protein